MKCLVVHAAIPSRIGCAIAWRLPYGLRSQSCILARVRPPTNIFVPCVATQVAFGVSRGAYEIAFLVETEGEHQWLEWGHAVG